MSKSTDRDNSFDDRWEIDMDLLGQLISQHLKLYPLFENITILGCGYIGKALAEYWQEAGHLVTGATTCRELEVLPIESTLKIVTIDGNDLTAMSSLMTGQNTLVVSPASAQSIDVAHYQTAYLNTVKNLVMALGQHLQVKQVIYLSSCSVYGERQGAWVDETTPIDLIEHNSHITHKVEQIILQAATERLKVCMFRLGGVYGPERELVSRFGGLAGTTMPGEGNRFVNWIHRDDIIGAIEFARSNGLNGIYNLVDDSRLTVKEQIKRVCDRYNLSPVNWDAVKFSLQHKSLKVSNQKLKAAGYHLIHPQLLV